MKKHIRGNFLVFSHIHNGLRGVNFGLLECSNRFIELYYSDIYSAGYEPFRSAPELQRP